LKIADNWGGTGGSGFIGLRRITTQTEDGFMEGGGSFLTNFV
jgi:hypothetical protein